MKLCTKCGVLKHIAEYAVRHASKNGYASACKICINERNRKKYAVDPLVRVEQKLSAKIFINKFFQINYMNFYSVKCMC